VAQGSIHPVNTPSPRTEPAPTNAFTWYEHTAKESGWYHRNYRGRREAKKCRSQEMSGWCRRKSRGTMAKIEGVFRAYIEANFVPRMSVCVAVAAARKENCPNGGKNHEKSVGAVDMAVKRGPRFEGRCRGYNEVPSATRMSVCVAVVAARKERAPKLSKCRKKPREMSVWCRKCGNEVRAKI
jgi:hypothetical protein